MLASVPDQLLRHEDTGNWVFTDNNWHSWYAANAGRRLTRPAYKAYKISNEQNASHDPNRMDWSPIFDSAITTIARINAFTTTSNLDLDADTLQVLQDILSNCPPNCLHRLLLPAPIDEILTISLDDIPTSTAVLSTFIQSSLRECLGHMEIAIVNNSVEKSLAKHLSHSSLTAILQHMEANDSNIDVVSIGALMSRMQEALCEESSMKRQRNVGIIKSYLDKDLSVYGIYQGLRGVECVSTIPVHGIDTILAESGCICGLGMLALSRSKLRSAHTTSADYLRLAIRFFFLELQYGKDRWETWYRLAQCYEALTRTAANMCEVARQSIHCYLLAISAAERDLHAFDSRQALSFLYHDFGVAVAYMTHLMMRHWPLNRRSTYKLAAGMFRKAINCFEGHWVNHFMLALFTSRMFDETQDKNGRNLRSEIDFVQQRTMKALQILSNYTAFTQEQDPRYNVHQEVKSLLQWLAHRRCTDPDGVNVTLNHSISVLLCSREKFTAPADTSADTTWLLQGISSDKYVACISGPQGVVATEEVSSTEVQFKNGLQNSLPESQPDSYEDDRTSTVNALRGTQTDLNTRPIIIRPCFPNSSIAPDDISPPKVQTKQSITPLVNCWSGLHDQDCVKSANENRETLTVPLSRSSENRPHFSGFDNSPGDRLKSHDLSKMKPQDIILLGMHWEKQLKINRSISCFKYLMNYRPKSTTRITWLLTVAPMMERAGKVDQAKKMYKVVLEQESENSKALKHLGILYHKESQSHDNQDRAIGYLERAIAFDRSDTQSWYLLGCSYSSRQFLFKAHEAFHQAIHRNPKNVDCWASLGTLNVKLKRYKDAQEAFETAIRLDKTRIESWVDMGNLMRELDKVPKAIESFNMAAHLDPSNVRIQESLRELIDAS